MTEQTTRFELLADLAARIAGETLLDDLVATLAQRVATALGAERATLWLLDEESGELRSQVATLPELAELRVRADEGVVGHVAKTGEPSNLANAADDPRWSTAVAEATGFRPGPMLTVPITQANQVVGVLQVLGKSGGTAFSRRDEGFAVTLAEQIGRALDYTSMRGSNNRVGFALRGRFNHIIGDSSAMTPVYDTIVAAARTDVTVLIRGETGTGKGLLARAIAINSARHDQPFVHVDCTTLPAGLVESELFGHERGAYTGAQERVIGKVEVAKGGTLFLDELGELPLALQAKLLRFVQDRTFERVGGRETLSSDVRIIAATHRDLAALVASGEFRSDLYFRLRVIEIEVPPLRSRGKRDVLELARHFLHTFCRRYDKKSLQFDDDALASLATYAWPGNVRELENSVERAVVLARSNRIRKDDLKLDTALTPAPLANPSFASDDSVKIARGLSLEDAERAYATAMLHDCDGNQTVAAKRLGISRNKLARLLRSES